MCRKLSNRVRVFTRCCGVVAFLFKTKMLMLQRESSEKRRAFSFLLVASFLFFSVYFRLDFHQVSALTYYVLYVFYARFLYTLSCTFFLTALQTQEPHEHIETLLGGYIVISLEKHHQGDHGAGTPWQNIRLSGVTVRVPVLFCCTNSCLTASKEILRCNRRPIECSRAVARWKLETLKNRYNMQDGTPGVSIGS